MKLGNKLIDLRKKQGLSQEEVAEKINVTRQTISKWELEETTPDIKQAKELAKLYNISLDELLDNDINNLLVGKVNNTERLAGLIITILKIFGVLILFFMILMVVSIILFGFVRKEGKVNLVKNEVTINCELKDKAYTYTVEYDENNEIISYDGDAYLINILDLEKYQYADQVLDKINEYFDTNGGSCN